MCESERVTVWLCVCVCVCVSVVVEVNGLMNFECTCVEQPWCARLCCLERLGEAYVRSNTHTHTHTHNTNTHTHTPWLSDTRTLNASPNCSPSTTESGNPSTSILATARLVSVCVRVVEYPHTTLLQHHNNTIRTPSTHAHYQQHTITQTPTKTLTHKTPPTNTN